MTREEAIELLEERKKFNRTMQRGWEQSEGVTASGKTVNTASFAICTTYIIRPMRVNPLSLPHLLHLLPADGAEGGDG